MLVVKDEHISLTKAYLKSIISTLNMYNKFDYT